MSSLGTRWHRARLGDWIVDRIEAPTERDEDRTGFALRGGVLRLALADGAGGMTGGRFAACFAIDEALARPADAASIAAIDQALADRGQTTLVTLALDHEVRGASVGDSRAWARVAGAWHDLTHAQHRKPLVGSGRARPEAFSLRGVEAIAIASDGLALPEAELVAGLDRNSQSVAGASPAVAQGSEHIDPPDLVALVDRLRAPTLRDDVSLLLAWRC